MAKECPKEVSSALTVGLKSHDIRVKTQCLRILSNLKSCGGTVAITEIVKLIKDPGVHHTAQLAARRLLENSGDLKKQLSAELIEVIENGEPEGSVHTQGGNQLMNAVESDNWREKLKVVEGLVLNLQECAPQVSQDLDSLAGLFIKLLADTNSRVVTGVLILVQDILRHEGLKNKEKLIVLVPSCIEKLGEEKVAYRQHSFRVLRLLLVCVSPKELLPFFLNSLKSEN